MSTTPQQQHATKQCIPGHSFVSEFVEASAVAVVVVVVLVVAEIVVGVYLTYIMNRYKLDLSSSPHRVINSRFLFREATGVNRLTSVSVTK
jgi:hypothetical protein